MVRRPRLPHLLACCVVLGYVGVTPGADAPGSPLRRLTVYPSPITLDGPRAEQRLGTLGEHADGRQWDYSRSAAFASGSTRTSGT